MKKRRPSSRRWALILLIGGLLLAALPLISKMPSERTVVVRVAETEGLERVELTWWRGEDAVHRTELAGAGETRMRLRDGQHRVELAIYRRGVVRTEERRIDVADGAERIVIDVP